MDTVASDFTDINPHETWQNIKTAVANALHLKSEWQGTDYGVDAWKLSDAAGNEIGDSDSFTVDTTVYAVTNYTKFNIAAGVLTGYTGSKPKGNITLPSGITKIGYNSFQGCSNLTGLVIPEGVTAIDAGAFSGCEKLEKLILPSTLTSIGGFAFYQCKNLEGELVLPNNITFFGEKAFMECAKITSVKIRSGYVSEIKDYAFSLKSSISDIRFTVKTQDVRDKLKGSKSGITDAQITIDSSI